VFLVGVEIIMLVIQIVSSVVARVIWLAPAIIGIEFSLWCSSM
jgi:hypothetical protein